MKLMRMCLEIPHTSDIYDNEYMCNTIQVLPISKPQDNMEYRRGKLL